MKFKQQLRKNINQKINSATEADRRCGRKNNLTQEAVIDKLFKQQALCYYCKQMMELVDWNKFSKKQFTLERISNSKAHYINNLVIACWGCNETRSNKYTCSEFKKKVESDLAWFTTMS
jgi:5-methylcytosine-specific restriction endonuclease McrA